MRIALVSPLYPPHLGGVERVVQELGVELASRGHEVDVVTSDRGAKVGVERVGAVTVRRLRSRLIANTPVIYGLFLTLLRLPTDIVHVHVAQAYTPEVSVVAARLRRRKIVAHVHLDVGPSSGSAGILLRVYKPLVLRAVLRAAHAVVVLDSRQREAVSHGYHVASHRMHIVPNGVQERFYKRESRQLRDKPRLLFVGRLSPQKNVALLLDALCGISDGIATDIVGDGELREELERKARHLELQNVQFHGNVAHDEIKAFYDAADLFVLTSEREGMPLAALEALAMRLPVVTTDVGGMRELLADGGIVVEPTAEAVRQGVTAVIGDKGTYAAYSEAASAAAKDLSWAAVCDRIEDIYQAV